VGDVHADLRRSVELKCQRGRRGRRRRPSEPLAMTRQRGSRSLLPRQFLAISRNKNGERRHTSQSRGV
jgi:hypothetical protein